MTDESQIKSPGFLPPLGQIQNELDHKGAWQYMSLLALEDRTMLTPMLQIADIGTAVFNWGDVEWDGQGWNPPSNLDQLQISQVQNDTIAVTKTTFREPVSFEIVCGDTGPYPPCYWCGPAVIPGSQPVTDQGGNPQMDLYTGGPAMQQVNLLEQWGLRPDQMSPVEGSRQQPIDQLQAMQISQQLQQVGYPSEWLCHADKRLVSSIYQTFYDGRWNDPKFAGQQWAYRFGLDANTQGWNTAMVEYRQGEGVVIVPLSIKQCCLDRQHVFINKMQHVMADFVFDVTWAKQQFPWINAQIDKYKQASGGTPVSIDGNTQWGQRDRVNFQRDIVVMRIGWFRDQPMPLTMDEAVQNGYVQQNEQIISGLDTSVDASGGITQEGNQPSIQANGGYTLHTGEPVTPPTKGQPLDPNWPMRTCLRRVMAIGGKIVSDMPEDHWDIPILHLTCFPVTNTPYGTGIPFKCWQIQKSRTNYVTSIKENSEYYAHPMLAGPTDVLEAMGVDAEGAFVRPNALIKINPEYLMNKRIDDVVKLINPDTLPQAIITGEQRMEEIQTKLSGNVAVLQGEPTSADDSGVKVQSLQEAAISQVNTGEDTEACLQRLAMLINHCHIRFATVDDVMKYYRKLPRGVLEAIHVDIAPTLHWEARASTADSGGMRKQRKAQQSKQDLEIVDPLTGMPLVDLQTAREDSGYDHEEIEERQHRQQAQMGPQQEKGPSESIGYKDVPPEAQIQMLKQAGIHVTPEQIMAHNQQQQEQKAQEARAKLQGAGGRMGGNGNGQS